MIHPDSLSARFSGSGSRGERRRGDFGVPPGETGPALVLPVNGASGADCQSQSSTHLIDWTAVFMTNPPAMPFGWTNNNTGLPRNFFRIQAGPPLP